MGVISTVSPLPMMICIGLPLMAVAIVLLVLALRSRNRKDEDNGAKSELVLSICILILASAVIISPFYLAYLDNEAGKHVKITYTVDLSLNGTGQIRVSLPVPIEQEIMERAQITPTSSSFLMNRSGAEASLDIIMTEDTQFRAELYGLWSDLPVDVTYTNDSNQNCYLYLHPCQSSVNMTVLSGNVADVHIVLHASWSTTCRGETWWFDCTAIPGRHEYPGNWGKMVC